MHRAYVEKTWIDSFCSNNETLLPEDVFYRFYSIVRIKDGEQVGVFDGCGRQVQGTLFIQPGKKSACFANATLFSQEPNSYRIILLQAALEEAKMGETIKRACEYGMDELIIFNGERSEPFCYNKLVKKHDRLVRIAKDACRQSGRLYIPNILFQEKIDHVIKAFIKDNFGVFGDVTEKKLLSITLHDLARQTKHFSVVIGPEGGLTKAECDILRKSGFYGVSWSPFVLRSETAALGALTLIHAHLRRA